MATPKKKVSRSRKNMRRFSAAYELDPVTTVTVDGAVTRPHRVTLATVAQYVEKRNAAKQARKAANK